MVTTYWKGWRTLSSKEFVPIFREREWVKILRGEDLILIPFPPDFKNLSKFNHYEDKEWEFQGVVRTAYKKEPPPMFPIPLIVTVVFRRRS